MQLLPEPRRIVVFPTELDPCLHVRGGMAVDLSAKSHVDTPAWQSFEMRMRARAAERRTAKRRRRIRRVKYAAAGVFALALGVLTAFAVRAASERRLLERAFARQEIVVEWPALPQAPALAAAQITSIPLPADWDAPAGVGGAEPEAGPMVTAEGELDSAETLAALPTKVGADARPESGGARPSEPGAQASAGPVPTAGRSAAANLSPATTRISARENGAVDSTEKFPRIEQPQAPAGRRVPEIRLAEGSASPDAQDRPAQHIAGAAQQDRVATMGGSSASAPRNRPTEPAGVTELPNPLTEPAFPDEGSSDPSVANRSRNPLAEPSGGSSRHPASRNPAASPGAVAGRDGNPSSETLVGASRGNLPSAPPVGTLDPREPVRRVLERYRSAYQRLDASAARAVWPGVDAAALARAFGSLASQELWFDRCSIDVSGASADATCTGQARVVPRIGGGTETTRRTWQFQLRQNGPDWVIEKATAK